MRSILKSSDNFSAIIFIFLLVLVFIHLVGVGKKKKTMAQEILGRLRALSSVQQRRAAAILGAVVADAASKLVLLDGDFLSLAEQIFAYQISRCCVLHFTHVPPN